MLFPALSQDRTTRGALRACLLATGIAASLALGACSKVNDITGSIGTQSAATPRDEAGWRASSAEWGRKYEANPADKTAAINYARALRALSQHAQAVAVLQQAAIKHSKDMEVAGAYGKALADANRLQEASEVLQGAHTPDRPNWSILSAQGSVADKMGNHTQAQQYYQSALKIVPGEPSVMSNLGLSYALSKQLPQAEQTMREAAASPRADSRVQQNLALVLGLQGKFAEAEEIERKYLSAAEAAANVANIRQMIAQSNSWRDLQQLDQPKKPKPGKKNG